MSTPGGEEERVTIGPNEASECKHVGLGLAAQRAANLFGKTIAGEISVARWAIIFATASAGTVTAVLMMLWGLNGFHGLGLDTAGTIAVVLGATVTSAFGVGLMGLIFYSDRSKADEEAYRATVSRSENGKEGNADARGK